MFDPEFYTGKGWPLTVAVGAGVVRPPVLAPFAVDQAACLRADGE